MDAVRIELRPFPDGLEDTLKSFHRCKKQL